MSDIKTLMEVSISDLSKKKHEVFKKYIMDVLSQIKTYINNDQYEKVLEMTALSPSGDGWGADNSFIDFHWDGSEVMDIGEAVHLLQTLKSNIGKEV